MKPFLIEIPASDWIFTTIFLVLILFLLFFLEKLSKIRQLSVLFTRKSVHLLVGLFIVLAIYILKTVYPILILSLIFSVFDFWAIRSQRFKSIHPDTKSYGTVYYPLAVFILSLILWDSYKTILIISILIMSMADVAAAVVGERYAQMSFVPFREKKSIHGSATMFVSTFIIVSILLFLFKERNFTGLQIIGIGFVLAIQATAAEMISSRGSDNLSVPFIVTLFLFLFWNYGTDYTYLQIVIGTILALIIAILSFYFGFLELSGGITIVMMGGIIFGIGGIRFAIPILVFFLLSSSLSYIKREYKRRFLTKYEKGENRDLTQTLANGGVATVVMLLTLYFPENLLYPVYLASLCAAAADTWATELGVLSWHKPRLITNWKIAEKGTSGAVSITGFLAALLGSIIVFLSGYLVYPESIPTQNMALVIVFSGFIGSIIDSVLGASLQVQYRCIHCGQVTERRVHCSHNTKYHRGVRFIGNDLVNVIANFCAVGLIFLFILMV